MGCGGSTPVTVKSPPPRTPTPPPPPPRETTADFASDCIDIQIDKGKDENEIQAKEDGYPEPTPSDQVDGRIKPKDKWFEDEDFNNASDDADLFKTEIAVDDDDIDIDTLSDTASYTSNPTRSARPNLLFDDVDNHAKLASSSHLDSFKDLVQYLKKPFENDRFKNMKTARAIVAWMSNRPMDGVDYGVATTDTPRGLMQYLKENRMTYTTCYTILCRKAGLQCVIIKGYVKAAGYEPGNKNVPEASWNAVHVECGWQLVHPFWVCRALYGHNLGGWVKVEVDGTTMSKKESASAGVVRNTFQERYFMPDPENFIYECYASDPQWQLVKPSSTVHSKEHFLEMPYLLPPFFGVNFELTSEQKCILYSEEGFCKVELKGKPANAHMIMLNYELFLKDTENDSKNGFQKEKNMSRMVFNSRGAEMFVFDIRFPARGTYKLVIYGGPYKSPALRLCEFRLICDKEMTDRNLLPLECSRIGWGPGPVSVEAGLLIPSKLSGLIPVNPNEKKTSIKFQLLREMKLTYRAHIYGEVGGQRITFDDNIEIEVTQLQQLHISAAIPTEGEFGLSIHRVTTGNQQERNICNYLLSTLAYKTVKADVKNAKKKLDDCISENVDPRQWKKKISDTEQCLDKCLKLKIPSNDEDIMAAKTVLDFLRCKDKLRDCKLRRHLGVTIKTLDLVSRYRNKIAVTKEIETVRKLKEELTALRGSALEKAHRDVLALHHPPVEVEDVFKSLLVLLGESDVADLEWASVQKRLKELAERESVLNRMKMIQKKEINKQKKQRVMEILGKYNGNQNRIREASSDAYRFYAWILNVIKEQGASL